jgi:serine protease Do
MNKKTISQLGLVMVVSGLLSGFIGAALYDATTKESEVPARIVEETVYVEKSNAIDAIESAAPSVISIIAFKDKQFIQQQPFNFFQGDPFFEQFFGPMQLPEQTPRQEQSDETIRRQVSGGSGFVVSVDGLAVTNKHVVNDENADYKALLPDGTEFDVEVISRDPLNDLAIIQLHEVNDSDENKKRKTGENREFGSKPRDLPVIALGDSDVLTVGQQVFAIGNARGEYENSVTAGIVSATGRNIEATDGRGSFKEALSNLIQTDAAINLGNSGGPLINIAGQVIGVNTAIDTSASGIGFAITINEVKAVLKSVQEFGRIVRPILGVRFLVIADAEHGKRLGFDNIFYGALIVGDRENGEIPILKDSPAEKAGLKLDDIILEVDGKKITTDNPLQTIVRSYAPGDSLVLKVRRGDEEFEVTVELDEFNPEVLKTTQ